MTNTKPLVSVRNLTVDFPNRHGTFRALDDVSFDILPGEILGVVGESGAGKSMTGAAIIGLLANPGRITAGEIHLGDTRLDTLTQEDLRKLRGKRIAMVMQDPLTSLNPLFTIGDQLVETIRHHLNMSVEAARGRAVALLEEVGIPDPKARLAAYPHQFSGGMRQRVVIALALAAEPELVIADEPTSALDVSVQAQILALLKDICTRRGASVMLISHDMGAIAETAQRMIVMNKGRIVESGPVGEVMWQPRAEYTGKLIASIPSIRDAGRPRPEPSSVVDAETLVQVDRLGRQFDLSSSWLEKVLRREPHVTRAVDEVSFQIPKGGTFGLVGESGSGKSTLARIVVGLIRPSAGRVLVDGTDIWAGGRAGQRDGVQMIFQDPHGSLNARWRIRDIIAEPLQAAGRSGAEIEDRVAALLSQVRLDPGVMRRFPHEFSGGQRQRIAIARALAAQPRFIVCDEPTSALDVSVQAQVLELMGQLQDEFGLTYLLISHDLAVVKRMCDHVGVMCRGRMVEQGSVDAIFDDPRDAYTRMLLDAVPDIARCRPAA